MTSRLFEPITIGEVQLPNRVVVAPMCQYSASEGCRRIRDEIAANA